MYTLGPWSESFTLKSYWYQTIQQLAGSFIPGGVSRSVAVYDCPCGRSGVRQPRGDGEHPFSSITAYNRYSTTLSVQVPAYGVFQDSNGNKCSVRGLGYRPMNGQSYPGPSDAEKTIARNEALARFYSALHATRFDSLTFAGEARESAHMIANRALALSGGLLKAYRTLPTSLRSLHSKFKRTRKGTRERKNAGAALAGASSNYWLENVYGWQPLISDLSTLSGGLAALMEKPMRIKVTGSSMKDSTGVYSGQGVISYIGHSVYFKAESLTRYGYKFGSTRTHAFGQEDPGRAALGLTWSQVPLSAWELTPYSFLFDYFLNISDLLSAYTANVSGLILGYSNYTRYTHAKWQHESVVSGTFKGPKLREEGMVVIREFSRSVFQPGEATAMPSLQMRVPSSNALTNVGALVMSRLSNLPHYWPR